MCSDLKRRSDAEEKVFSESRKLTIVCFCSLLFQSKDSKFNTQNLDPRWKDFSGFAKSQQYRTEHQLNLFKQRPPDAVTVFPIYLSNNKCKARLRADEGCSDLSGS